MHARFKDHGTILEEIFNAITHGIGIILSAVGLVILLKLAEENYNSAKFIGFSVFGAVILFSYTLSTLYHSLIFTRARKIFKIFQVQRA